MAKNNRELISYYKNKHELEPVLFSEKDGSEEKLIDGIVVPLKLDLRQFCSPTDDQGDTSHCAAYSAAQILEAKYWRKTGKLIQLDASHIYAKAKEKDGIIDEYGTFPETALSAALELGNGNVIDSSRYVVKKFYNNHNDQTILGLKHLIHKNGFLAGGFNITEDWYDLSRGNSILEKTKRKNIGGHCVTVVGYFNDSLIIQNSWGKQWGASGFGRISWDIVLKQFMYAAYLEE